MRDVDYAGRGSLYDALMARVAEARDWLERDPDVAALLLDGVLAGVCELCGGGVADLLRGSTDASVADDEVAIRLRLALRAPSVRARLVQCEDVLERVCVAALPHRR